jgi:hypothetical protein
MPFGERKVGKKKVDFDTIYQEIFKPAIKRVRVENRVTLVPKRADDRSNTRILTHGMIRDLLLSRLILADLSVPNTNVGIEVGLRYSFTARGTVLVKLIGTSTPFDIAATAIQVTQYSNMPPEVIADSQKRIATTLRETLRYNEVDNPYYAQLQQLATRMGTPENPTKLGSRLVDAEESARSQDLKTATKIYAEVEKMEPGLAPLHRRRASLLIRDNSLDEAALELKKLIKINPDSHEEKRWLEEIQRGDAPKPLYMDPTSWDALKVIIESKYLKESKPEITLTPHWREDGSLQADFLISTKPKKKYEQIVDSILSFGQVKELGIVIFPESNQTFQKFSLFGNKSCEYDAPDKMLSEIKTRTGIEGLKVDPGDFRTGGDFKGRGGFGGGFGGGFLAG